MKIKQTKLLIAMIFIASVTLTSCSDKPAPKTNTTKSETKPVVKTVEKKCGDDKADKKCGEGKCGDKDAEKKCGEGKCGDKDADKKCGEGKCGDSMKDKAVDAVKGAVKGKCGADKMKDKAIKEVKEVVKDKISG